MIVFRLLGAVALIVAIVAGARDAVLTTSAEKLVLTPLGKDWFTIDAESLNLTQAVIERYLLPGLWDPVFLTILQWPTWVGFAGLGLLLILVGNLRRS